MLRIVLIHPGSTDYDAQQRIQGALDIPLNEQGAADAATLGRELADLGVEVIYTPAHEPAEQTAQAVATALGVRLRTLDHLHNLDHGLWQGMRIDEVRQKQPRVYRQWQEQPESVCPPEGEMLGQADERVRHAVVRLLKRHKEGVIGLVVPEPLLSLVRRFVIHCELGDLWKAVRSPCSWEVLEVDPEVVLAPSG
jgi:phosphoserine phosphatase